MDTNEAASRSPRPRNSAATKELLLTAATAEFAEFGLAGARIDRIAERAGANKRLLYVYFGDKDQLFEAALHQQIGKLAQETPLVDGDLVAYAAARFDFMLAHPETARLAAWLRFERHGHSTQTEIDSYRSKVDAIVAAQREGRVNDSIPAVDLFAMVLRLTESWLDAPPALAAVTGTDPRSAHRLAEHRAALLEATRRITAPRTGDRPDDADA
ncbi:TetR family transcriptional regulator [Streptomyces sp. NPDC002962]|uniref:TetR/AcrR family transcriptional regulator n=1 Tax=Streptomyces sp. NPDC002962 TaxID=3364674 RepID=UPI0036A17C6C